MNILILIFCFISPIWAQSWNTANDPKNISNQFMAKMEKLPLAGELSDLRKGWPANHWSNNTGGIAFRWSAGTPEIFNYRKLKLEELKKLKPYQLNELSPAEKFDIFEGKYHYPLTTKVLTENAPTHTAWFGICHGVAPASLYHAEPKLVQLLNRDGISLTFYSSDVAALMSYYYAKMINQPASMVGTRCRASLANRNLPAYQSSCSDTHPAAFHIVLSNKLGITKDGFIADVDPLNEVWNHVAIKYRSKVVNTTPPVSTSAKNTVKRVRIESVVTYASAIAPKFYPVIGTPDAFYSNYSYEYFLDVNLQGVIIGGEWISGSRPDFVWTKKPVKFTGAFQKLNQIYQPID